MSQAPFSPSLASGCSSPHNWLHLMKREMKMRSGVIHRIGARQRDIEKESQGEIEGEESPSVAGEDLERRLFISEIIFLATWQKCTLKPGKPHSLSFHLLWKRLIDFSNYLRQWKCCIGVNVTGLICWLGHNSTAWPTYTFCAVSMWPCFRS